jgi:hypothetical protein
MALSSLGLLFIGAIPTVIGVAEAIDGQKKQNEQAKERIKFTLTAKFSADGKSPPADATVVFKDSKVIRHVKSPPCDQVYSTSDSFLLALPRPPRPSGLWLQVQRLLLRLPGPGGAPRSGVHGI